MITLQQFCHKSCYRIYEAKTWKHRLCMLHIATAPFVEPDYIRDGLKKIIDTNANFSFSVTSFPFPIQRAIKITKDHKSQMFSPKT